MQRTVQNAVTHNEGDTVWNSFMRCRLLNYFVHGTIPQFICIFLSLSQIRLYFSALSSIRICYSYDSWYRIISENLVWYWFINPFLGPSCFLSSFEWKNECAYVFGGPYLSFLVSFGVNRYLSGGLYLSFLVSSRANHYPSGGLYLPFWLLRLCNRFCFSFVSLLLFCNLIISDKNMFVNKKIDKI